MRWGKTVPISAWSTRNIPECRRGRPHLAVVHVEPAIEVDKCLQHQTLWAQRLSLICHPKEALDYNCLLSWNSSCHAEVADGGWQSGVTLGFLQLSPEADQNYGAHKNNHVNNLLCRQDDGTVIPSMSFPLRQKEIALSSHICPPQAWRS